MSDIRITGLAITPVKGTRLNEVNSIRIEREGVWENRRFFLIDESSRMVNSTHLGALNTIVSDYSDADRRLALSFADGHTIEEELELGEQVTAQFYSGTREARVVHGGFSEAISDYLGRPLRLVEAGRDGGVDRGDGAVTLVSRASLSRLAEQAGRDEVDPRRFRMLIELDGIGPHEEDGWITRTVEIGEAEVRPLGHVGRCVITSRHPETGEIDLHTLKILGSYRKDLDTTEPVAFGIFGEVLAPGTVRIGDAVAVT